MARRSRGSGTVYRRRDGRWEVQFRLAGGGRRVHDLRHTTASVLLASSTHPKVVQELLGHRTVALTLDTYSHLLPPMTRTAATVIDAAVAGGVSSAWA